MSNTYEFTKLSEVEAIAEVPENANALVEVDGAIKRVSGSGLGGSSSSDLIVNATLSEDMSTATLDKTVPEIYEAFNNNRNVVVILPGLFGASELIGTFKLNRIAWRGEAQHPVEMDFNNIVWVQNEILTFFNFRFDGHANSDTFTLKITSKVISMTGLG